MFALSQFRAKSKWSVIRTLGGIGEPRYWFWPVFIKAHKTEYRMQRGHASIYREAGPLRASGVIGQNAMLFFGHLFSAAHQRNTAGIFRSCSAGAGLFNLQFKSASIAMIKISFFHVATICHGKPPLVTIPGRLTARFRTFY